MRRCARERGQTRRSSIAGGIGAMKAGAETLGARVYAWLWRDTSTEPSSVRILIGFLRRGFAVSRDLAGGQLTLRAMSLVYTTLLSLVPLLAISFSILKGFGVHNQVEPFLLAALEPLGERAGEITAQIIEFVDNVQVGVLGLVGFVLLFYTVLSLMQKIESAFNEVWQVRHERSIAERFRDYLSVIVVGPVLIFTALGIIASFFASQFMQGLRLIGPLDTLIELSGRMVPVVMVVAGFTFVYVFVPNTRVRWLPAFSGGLIAGVLWNLLGLAFAKFVASTSSYAAIYSGFATPIFFMIWLYLGWLVLLLGASIAFYGQHPEYLAGRRVAASFSIVEREQVALHALHAIGERYYGEQPAVSVDELSLALGIPPDVVEQMLGALTREGLIAPTDEDPPRFLPARPWETATLADALEAVRRARGGLGAYTGELGSGVPVQAAMAVLTRVTHEAFGCITLKQFATDESGLGGSTSSRAGSDS
jgi:membrane protein